MRTLPSALLITVLVLVAVPLAAHADDTRAAAGASATKSAKQHFKKGRALQRTGGYDQAIAEYEWAYKLAPRPELLFNIGQCHRLAGRADEAIDYYLRFLEDAPANDPAVGEARAHVLELRRRQALAPVRPVVPAAAPVPAPATSAEVDRDPEPAPTVAIVATPRVDDEGEREDARPMKWVGVGSVISGAALIGMGTYYGVRAAQAADELDDTTGPWTPELAARESAARSDETRLYYLAGGGGALVVLGAALWWWDQSQHTPPRAHELRASPSVSPGAAGMVIEGTF